MVDLSIDGTISDDFPFKHLCDLNSDNDSIISDVILNIQDTIATNIVLPFPSAFHVVHINAEDLLCHFADVYNLFFSSGINVILISVTWLKSFHSNSIVNIPG
jgi:hypothetical protein